MEDICNFVLREAEKNGANYCEAYGVSNKESEVFIENNDLKQSKSHRTGGLGIRVFVNGSLGFSSTNILEREHISNAVRQAIKLARVSPSDKYNSMPFSRTVKLLNGIYDRNSESFNAPDTVKMAVDMLDAAKSYDNRVSVDSGNFTSSVMTHALLNSNGVRTKETISAFSWSIMGMAIDGSEVSNFDFQFGGTHNVKDIDVRTTSREFGKSVVNSLGSKKIESFKGEMLLTPSAVTELILDVIAYSINSQTVQKEASKFKGQLGKTVSSDLLTLIDDATNVNGLGASSFDREGMPHKSNLIIEKGILKKFLYNTYTANKDHTESTSNAGGSPKSPPIVSTTNVIIKAGKSRAENLISEMDKGIIINRFSGNVNPVNGDFSGVVKGGQYIKKGNIEYAVKEVMVTGNVFDALNDLNGISKEQKILSDSILPYMRFENVSFTAG
ncbi:MAG TPA: TldD/PmbA family protein [Nitrososphaeraceae archaeon]|nr:TldD/PmbA family protein [Nitrososphaeraceae archaeon]